jgi:hypothetical protein
MVMQSPTTLSLFPYSVLEPENNLLSDIPHSVSYMAAEVRVTPGVDVGLDYFEVSPPIAPTQMPMGSVTEKDESLSDHYSRCKYVKYRVRLGSKVIANELLACPAF